jgi:hypothetical protein
VAELCHRPRHARPSTLGPNARVNSMTFVAFGVGDIDYKKVFAHAELAELK